MSSRFVLSWLVDASLPMEVSISMPQNTLLFSRMIAPYRAEFVDSGAQLEGGRLVRSAHPTTAKSQPGGRGISIAPYDSHGGSL